MARNYSIEEAELSTAAQAIQSLWERNLTGHDATSVQVKLRLGYLDNPAGRGTVLLLRCEGLSHAQGTQGLHPRRFHLGPRSIRAIGLADFVVNADHRSLGPALMLMRRGAEVGAQSFDLTYGFPNAKAAPVCARAGLKRLGTMRRYAKPLASREQLATRMPRWLARCCAPMVDRALSLLDWTRRCRLRAPLACRPAPWDDPAFDELWTRRPAATLLSERTGRMLHWRFGAPGRGAWQVCVARDRSDTAMGYVVWRSAEGFAEIGDFFAKDPQTMTLALMLAFVRLAARSGVQSISVEFFGGPRVTDQLLGAGMISRPDQMAVFIGATTAAELESPEFWYLTAFDNDAD